MRSPIRAKALMPFLVPAAILLLTNAASAGGYGTGGGGGGGGAALPWETPLANLAGALTGNTAKFISIIAIFVAGVALIFGEDLGQFARRILMIVIAIAFLLGAASFIAPLTNGVGI